MFRNAVRRVQLSVLAGTRSVMNTRVQTSGFRERCLNKVQLLGRVGIEPKVFGKEGTLVSFPLGTTLRYRTNNEDGSVSENYRTTWHLLNVRIPRLREYVLNNVRKGTRLLVNGRLEYTQGTREDGSIKDYTVIHIDDVIIMAQPRQTEEPSQAQEEETQATPQDSATSDSLQQ